ncbi:MAG: response regulator, partial [Alphaproteobacteria bacterium]
SGAEALIALEGCRPDLALLDYAMPGMHGADLARAALEMQPDLPIVFATGYAESEQLDAALGSGAPVLRKPFSVAELADAVSRHALQRA